MTTNSIDRILYVDESGTPGGDPNQHWLVLAGVEVPTCQISTVEQFYDQVCQNFLPVAVTGDGNLDLKGWQLFRETPTTGPRWLKELPFDERIEFGRQLLSIPYSQLGVRFYVSAIDTRQFPDSSRWGFWPASVEDLLGQWCKTYLFALSEMIGDFAFHLDRDLSSGVDELRMRPREERTIENGRLLIDEHSILKPRLQELEIVLRKKREYSLNGRKLFDWSVLDGNVHQPWEFGDSKVHKPLELADILAAIVRLKHTKSSLPPDLDRVYFQSRLMFQCTRSHFYPCEHVDMKDIMHWAGTRFDGPAESAMC